MEEITALVTEDESSAFVLNMVGCARCLGDGHEAIEFKPLTNPIFDMGDNVVHTHWAPCPTNGEPILLCFVDDES